MVMTPSTMLTLGTKAPAFSLPDVTTRKTVHLTDFQNKKALLVMFICCHCPFVIHVKKELAKLGRDFSGENIGIVGISSNDVSKYPKDSPDSLKKFAKEEGIVFPILYDETQRVAKDYYAACTPDFFLFDQDLKLVYRGQLDSSRPDSGIPVTGEDLRLAIDAVLNGQGVPAKQKPSLGCNIKWKPGNEPGYFTAS